MTGPRLTLVRPTPVINTAPIIEAFDQIRTMATRMVVSTELLADTMALGAQMEASVANRGRRCTATTASRSKPRCRRKGTFTGTETLFRCWQHQDTK